MSLYKTIQKNGSAEIEIKKSRFICTLQRVDTEEKAKQFIQEIKKEYWKAAHHCSAWIIKNPDLIQRSSDDGEPSGTAGIPMLEVLKKQELVNVCAVVTRYFGGTKLGTGGLIRAYSQAVSHALAAVGLVIGKPQQEIQLTIQYAALQTLTHFLQQKQYPIKETQFEDTVKVICLIDQEKIEIFLQAVTDLLHGQVSYALGDCYETEIPIEKNV